jgi:hypothetical protein
MNQTGNILAWITGLFLVILDAVSIVTVMTVGIDNTVFGTTELRRWFWPPALVSFMFVATCVLSYNVGRIVGAPEQPARSPK